HTTTTAKYGQDGWRTEQDFWGDRPAPVGNENFDAWADLNGSNALTERRFFGAGTDRLVARVDVSGGSATATYWYLTDVRGSVVGLLNNSAVVVETRTYDGYGNVLTDSAPTLGDRYAYTGRELDPVTGLES